MRADDSHAPLRVKVYEALRVAILQGSLEAGEEIREAELSAALGVSRTPIREALQRLENEGWLKRVQGKGMAVTGVSEKDVRDLYLMRSVLEGLAVTLASPALTEDTLKRLEWTVEEMGLHTQRRDPEAVALKNKEFHWRIVELSGSRPLISTLQSVYEQIDRVRESSLWVPGRLEEAFREHRAIFEALKHQRTAEAAELVRQHVVRAGELMIQELRAHAG